MKFKNPLLLITSVILYSSIFIASLYAPADPDLGWHLKYGQYFFENNEILRDNTFSALMPDYKWINSSWFTDLISYQAFDKFSFLGLSVLGALVVTLTFFFLGKAAKLNLFEKSIMFPITLYLVSPVNQVSFRGQMLSLFFFAALFYILFRYYQSHKKIALTLIPLFALWSNIHGEFILGVAILAIWTTVFLAKEIFLNYRRDLTRLISEEKFLLLAVVGSLIATLINPFGTGVYFETIKHFGDPMQKAVTEWLSPEDFSTVWWHLLFAGMVIVMGVTLLGTGKKNFDKAPFYFPSFILFIFTFWIRRYAWPFYYSLVFLLQPIANYFEPDNKKISNRVSLIIASSFLLIVIGFKYPFDQIKEMNWESYCKESVGCSPTAAKTVIAKKLNNEKLLTIYDYGGWLIWNYPQIKPTIDGRMHLWRDDSGYSGFEYFYKIEQNEQDINESSYNAVLTSKRKPIYNRLIELSEEGKWREIHEDKFSAVFIRNMASKSSEK